MIGPWLNDAMERKDAEILALREQVATLQAEQARLARELVEACELRDHFEREWNETIPRAREQTARTDAAEERAEQAEADQARLTQALAEALGTLKIEREQFQHLVKTAIPAGRIRQLVAAEAERDAAHRQRDEAERRYNVLAERENRIAADWDALRERAEAAEGQIAAVRAYCEPLVNEFGRHPMACNTALSVLMRLDAPPAPRPSRTTHAGGLCLNGRHVWTDQFGDDYCPDVGEPCHCGKRQWGIAPTSEPSRTTEEPAAPLDRETYIAQLQESTAQLADRAARAEVWPGEPSRTTAGTAGDGWQPIETAPKDGQRVMLWEPRWTGPCSGQFYCDAGVWRLDESAAPFRYQPTQWSALPAPPVPTPASEGTEP